MLVFLLLGWGLYRLFNQFVRLRRECYTREAVSKGALLQQIRNQ